MMRFLHPPLFSLPGISHLKKCQFLINDGISRDFFFRSFSSKLSPNPKNSKSSSTVRISFSGGELLSSPQSLLHHLSEINNNNFLGGRTRFFSSSTSKNDFIFRQLIDYKSFTYTYLLADPKSKEGIIIDPVLDNVTRDLKTIKELGVKLLFAMNTHVHADHITGSGLIKENIPSCKSLISVQSQAKADRHFEHGDVIQFGDFNLECRSTPGHTNGCYSFVWHEKSRVFTGDAVLIRGCGRTDFQQGDSEKLYESVQREIFSLPSQYFIFPAHDYRGQTMSTVGEEKVLNPRLSKSKTEFIKIMRELQLPYPSQIDKALPANLLCGIQPGE